MDIDPEEIARNYPVALGLMADVDVFLDQVVEALGAEDAEIPPARADWLRSIDGWRNEWEEFTAPGYREDTEPMHPQRAAYEIDKALPDDAILISDVGVHHNWLIQCCRPKGPQSLIGSMGFGAMGFGVAGVLGAKLAAPDRPCGRGVRRRRFCHAPERHHHGGGNTDIPAVWVVWNNYAFASIRGLQRGYLGGRELATDFQEHTSARPYNPDFAAIAESAGLAGVRVDKAADLSEAVDAAVKAGRPCVIDANIQGEQNPGGAGAWELPGLGYGEPAIGARTVL